MVRRRRWRTLAGALAAPTLVGLLLAPPSNAALVPPDALYVLWGNDAGTGDLITFISAQPTAPVLHAARPRADSRYMPDSSGSSLAGECSGSASADKIAAQPSPPLNSFQVLSRLRLDSYELFDDGTSRSLDYVSKGVPNRCDQARGPAAGSSAVLDEYALPDAQQPRPHFDPIRIEVTQVDAVPEPGTYAMFGVGAIMLGLRLDRRRHSR